jgi:hypothetical protein
VKTKESVSKATIALGELEKGCKQLFRAENRPHGLLRDLQSLREQFKEMKQALQL